MDLGRFFATGLFLITGFIASQARADFDSSKAWFSSLDQQTRTQIQAELILLGDYDALADGRFGLSTFNSLQSYQSSKGQTPNGVLGSADLGLSCCRFDGQAVRLT